jgi:hypothetical protein
VVGCRGGWDREVFDANVRIDGDVEYTGVLIEYLTVCLLTKCVLRR